jgi:hypothetical protein
VGIDGGVDLVGSVAGMRASGIAMMAGTSGGVLLVGVEDIVDHVLDFLHDCKVLLVFVGWWVFGN